MHSMHSMFFHDLQYLNHFPLTAQPIKLMTLDFPMFETLHPNMTEKMLTGMLSHNKTHVKTS